MTADSFGLGRCSTPAGLPRRTCSFSISASLLLVTSMLVVVMSPAAAIDTRQSLGTKGKFFVHTLHSATFFPSTVPVEWTATLKGRPLLPVWMQLVRSKHSAIAYLVGTPVGRLRQLTVHVIAKRLDNFQIVEQFVVITIQDDSKFARSTQEVVNLYIKNHDVEDLISDRTGLIGQLEEAAKNTFRGKNVNPYIQSLTPVIDIPPEKRMLMKRDEKIGAIASIGSQRRFYSNIHNLVSSIQQNKRLCTKKNLATIDQNFSPTFDIDWCKTTVKRLTLVRDFADEETEKEFRNQKTVELGLAPSEKNTLTRKTDGEFIESGFSFFESILVFPFIAVFCIVLILFLSAIFFGCREGQQWRDYKTPKEQLEEYASVREGQRKLRELSVQRQLLLRSEEKANSIAPSDIHTFLQPKSLPRYPGSLRSSRNVINKSRSQINENTPGEVVAPPIDSIPIGKQTVAEAARACGSSLHLYRNPLDTESDNDERDEKDSLDDGVIESA